MNKSVSPLDLIHTDIWGPAPVLSSLGYSYYIHFLDDFSKFSWFFVMKSRANLQSLNQIFTFSISLPYPNGSPPNYHFLQVFGCCCYPYLCPYIAHKLDFRSRPCVFLGYPSNCHGYRCLDPTSGRIFIAHSVVFDELSFPFFSPASSLPPSMGPLQVSPIVPTSLPIPPHSNDLALPPSPSWPSTPPEAPTRGSSRVSHVFDMPDIAPRVASLSNRTVTTSSRTHRMVTRTQDGTLPPKRFSISRHPSTFTISSDSQEPRTFL